MTSFHDLEATTLTGDPKSLGDFAGTVLLVVNVASKCALTPHYEGLEKLQQQFGPRGFSVLAFPCNQFGEQEPGTESEIRDFCREQFGATFPLFAKIDVNGTGRHPVYDFLAAADAAPDGAGDIQWNFAKFLIDRSGRVAARFAPPVEPLSDDLVEAIERALAR